MQLVINNISNIIIQWGKGATDNDGVSRITLPLSFSSIDYGVSAIHSGGDVAIYAIHHDYKSPSFLPIFCKNRAGDYSNGWVIYWIAVGY